jgi:hypothetical protein
MLSSLRPIGVAVSVLAASMSVGCSLVRHTSSAPSDPSLPAQVHANPLLHEALVSSYAGHSRHPLDVLYPPPSPLPERPSEPKPAGDNIVWAPGYWIWDTREDNWLWIHGVWVHAPPGRRWVPGCWSLVADGWRWVPGYWAIDPPTPPSAPPVLAYSPNGNWLNDPGLAFFAGYGMWWPLYPYWSFHRMHHSGETVPAVVSPTQHATEPRSFPLPHLASNVHDAPSPLPHPDMASVFASVPKPLASALNPPERFELHTAHPLFALDPGAHDHAERISSLFSTAAHLEMTHHEHLGFHGDFAAHALSSERGHEGGSHGSEGHGGGHGR